MTVSELAVIFLVLFLLLHWLGIFATTRAILAILAVTAIGGFLGRMLVDVATWLQHATGAITGWALGVSVPAVLFIVLAVILIHDLHPRNGATRRTGWVALATGVLLVAGVAGIPALAPVAGFLRSLLSDIAGFINSL
jgi:hypothetical protein